MKKLDITGIIIAKNSSETILNSILSLKPICSQIVVVDTGSTDNTPQIALKNGCDVHFFKWVNDFSIARNYSLKLARKEWILILDSDECIDYESYIEFLKDIKIDNSIGGVRLKIINLLNENKVQREHKYTRLFRNNQKFTFKGKIHEQIADSILEANFQIVDSDIIIYHYGYSSNQLEKIERNRELLELELNENNNDDWLKYHLAETEFSGGNFTKAFNIFNEVKDSIYLSTEQKEITKIRLGQISLKNDEYKLVEEFLDFPSSDKNREGFRLFVLATSYLVQNNLELAEDLLTKFVVMESNMVPKDQLAQMKQIIIELRNIQNSSK